MTFNLISPAQIIGIRCGEHAGLNGWINLPKNLSLSYNLGCDWMEEELWSFGPFMLTRLLSDEEQEEKHSQEYWEDVDANRYTEWSY
ncbi:MAG: hypothetical protein EBT93_12765 [Alphaproteobacteria bacterium]|jgi:hypothetical protein|nr:hypothetical protein [Alphaproteobacteria bacterium]